MDEEQLQARRGGKRSTGPVVYPSAAASSYTSGTAAAEKMRLRLETVRKREADNTRASCVKVYVQERLERKLAWLGRCRPCGLSGIASGSLARQ